MLHSWFHTRDILIFPRLYIYIASCFRVLKVKVFENLKKKNPLRHFLLFNHPNSFN